MEGFVALEHGGEVLFATGLDAILATVLLTLIGLALYLRRTRASA